jgi:hypothetical protein
MSPSRGGLFGSAAVEKALGPLTCAGCRIQRRLPTACVGAPTCPYLDDDRAGIWWGRVGCLVRI